METYVQNRHMTGTSDLVVIGIAGMNIIGYAHAFP